MQLKSRRYLWVRNQASLCAVEKRKLKSEFFETEINLKRMPFLEQEQGRTGLA